MNGGLRYRILNFKRHILEMLGNYLESARLGDQVLRWHRDRCAALQASASGATCSALALHSWSKLPPSRDIQWQAGWNWRYDPCPAGSPAADLRYGGRIIPAPGSQSTARGPGIPAEYTPAHYSKVA